MANIYGTAGKDNPLKGTSGNDSIYGLAGEDLIITYDGDDYVDAGDGDDQVNGYPALNGGYSYYEAKGNLTIYGGNGNDFLVGGEGNDKIYGDSGNDIIYGRGGSDILDGGDGDDTINAQSDGADSLYGGNGNDVLNAYLGTGDKLLDGGAGNDQLNGGAANDQLIGGLGDDKLYGYEGNDTLDGGEGNDTLDGGEGNDIVKGGDGDDKIFAQNSGNDSLYGGNGNDVLDAYTGTGAKLFDGGAGNDELYGGIGKDQLIGGLGDDKLYGYEGSDTLDGGDGNDTLDGGVGNDTYYISNQHQYIYDSSGTDTAYVSASFVKIPSSIEKVIYTNGAQALPYWIDALLPDSTAGKYYTTLLGDTKVFGYIFPTAIPSYDTSANHAKGFTAFTSVQQSRTFVALSYISSVLDLQFSKVTNAAALNTLTFASNNQPDSAGYAQYPYDDFRGSDVFLDRYSSNETLANGEYGALTLIHEIGHALGLEHPFSSALTGTSGSSAAPPYLTGVEDTTEWTVMSYTDSSAQYYLQYSPLDIAALQYLYGPSKTARTGNDTYAISSSTANFVWDGAGIDVIYAGGVTQAVTIYLTPGYQGYLGSSKAEKITTAGQITVNFGSVIENLIGSNYDDRLYGNDVGNKIEGGTGSDSIEGWDGNDTLLGGAGDDHITGGSGNDSVEGGDGNDTLIFNGLATNYTIRYDSTSLIYSIEAKSGTEGKDTFKSIEFLKFSDKTLALQSIDLTPPTIAISSNVTSLGLGKTSTIRFTFSESVSDFVLADVAVTGGTLSNFTGSASAYAATFTPTLNFTGTASLKVTSGKFTDSVGNTNVDGAEANNNLSIAIDTQAPVITNYSPENSATKVGVASNIVLTFSEKIQKGTGNIVLKTSAGVTVATYEVASSSNLIISGTSLTINPSVNLSFDTGYKVEITAGAIKDLFANEFPTFTTYNFTTVNSIIGTMAGEILNGTAYEDNILGYGGNDTITGGFGSDVIDGGDGLDSVKFTGSFGESSLSNYSIKRLSSGDWSVSFIRPIIAIYPPPATDGIDTLVNVERLQFTDKSFALDLEGNAGITAKIIGAVLGKTALKETSYFGTYLSYLDKGMSYSDLGALVLNNIGATTNDSIVSRLWLNVIGSPASALDKAPFVKMLDDGMKPGDLVVLAADTAFNTANINLVGLAQTGIEYTPV